MANILPILLPSLLQPKRALLAAFESGATGFSARYVGGDLPLAPRMHALGDDLRPLSSYQTSPEIAAAITEIASDGLAHRGSGRDTVRMACDGVFSHTEFGAHLPDTLLGWDAIVLPTMSAIVPTDSRTVDRRSLALFRYSPPDGAERLVGLSDRLAELASQGEVWVTASKFQVLHIHELPCDITSHQRIAWTVRLRADIERIRQLLIRRENMVMPAIAIDHLGINPETLA